MMIELMLAAFWTAHAATPQVNQTFTLHPGWNAVFLEVDPGETDLDTLFTGIPIASVWMFDPSFSSREFIREQSEELVNRPEWLAHFPAAREESMLNNLFLLQANRAFLIKLEGTQQVDWHVTGAPQLRYPKWVPNAYNLTGFPVDPVAPATFEDFFAHSPAHAGQPVFRLDAAGNWEEITAPASTLMVSGEAYWVYAEGATDFRAPLSIQISNPNGLYFERGISRLSMTVGNLSAGSGGISLVHVPDGDAMPLKYWHVDGTTNESAWLDLPPTMSTDPDHPLVVWLAASRRDFPQEEMTGVLEISDGVGTRWWVPTHAFKTFDSGTAKARSATPYTGLWVGSVTVDGVSEAFSQSPDVPQTTVNDFSYRVLIHVDDAGQTRLLKEVTLMWEDGVEGESGRYVLITNPDLIPNYKGATLVDGEGVGYRISCLAYDFNGIELALAGDFGWVPDGTGMVPGNPLTGELVLGVDDATNPFKHKFHPDHDNKTADFEEFTAEAYEIRRNMTFEFTENDPDGEDSPQWGSSEMGGIFRETVSGLFAKKIPGGGGAVNDLIHAEGTFKLERISAAGVINE